jgi:hypothetical protein
MLFDKIKKKRKPFETVPVAWVVFGGEEPFTSLHPVFDMEFAKLFESTDRVVSFLWTPYGELIKAVSHNA